MFTIGQDIDSSLNLLAHAFGYGAPNARFIDFPVITGAADPGLHKVEKIIRARQAADVRCQNTTGIVLDAHWDLKILFGIFTWTPTLGLSTSCVTATLPATLTN